MAQSNKVLVYHFRHSGAPVVSRGLGTIRRTELDDILRKNPHLRVTRKPLSRGALAVTIYRRDLLPAPQKQGHVVGEDAVMAPAAEATLDANVAGLRIPLTIWVRRLVGGVYRELWVVSAIEPDGRAS